MRRMTEEIEKSKSAALYNAPEIASLGAVEKLTAGNHMKYFDPSGIDYQLIGEEGEPKRGEEEDKPKPSEEEDKPKT
jgi:hypothetical protein